MAAKVLEGVQVSAVSLSFQIDRLGYLFCADCIEESRGGEVFKLRERDVASLRHSFGNMTDDPCGRCSADLWHKVKETYATATIEYHGVKIF